MMMMMMFRRSTTSILVSTLLLLARFSEAFELVFPSPTSYWVSCGWNTVSFTANETDPDDVTLMLNHPNKSILASHYEIGNALETVNYINSYLVFVPCIQPSDQFNLLFVNSSRYLGNDTKDTLYTSPAFSIKAKGTTPDKASNQTSIPLRLDPDSATPNIPVGASGTTGGGGAPGNTSVDPNNITGPLNVYPNPVQSFNPNASTDHRVDNAATTIASNVVAHSSAALAVAALTTIALAVLTVA